MAEAPCEDSTGAKTTAGEAAHEANTVLLKLQTPEITVFGKTDESEVLSRSSLRQQQSCSWVG